MESGDPFRDVHRRFDGPPPPALREALRLGGAARAARLKATRRARLIDRLALAAVAAIAARRAAVPRGRLAGDARLGRLADELAALRRHAVAPVR